MAKHKKAAKKRGDELVRSDGYVGSRVCARRMVLGMSQSALAEKLGITFQQLQKNEKGPNRIASSRLLELSQALAVPIQYFFDEMPKALQATATAEPHQVTDGRDESAELLTKTETLKLVRAYYEIGNPRVRKRVYALAMALGATRSDGMGKEATQLAARPLFGSSFAL